MVPDAAPGTWPEIATADPATDGFGDEPIVILAMHAAVTGQQTVLGGCEQHGSTVAAAGPLIGGPQQVPPGPASGQMTAEDAPEAVDGPAETAIAPTAISAANNDVASDRRI